MKMKTLFLGMIAALALTTQMARAEDGGDGKFAFGPQGGLVFSDYSVDNAPFGRNYDDENGFIAGLFLEFGVWTVTLRPEINYVEKKFTVANTAEVTNKYVEIPLLLKVNPFSDFVVSPFIVLGPSWSNHLGSDVKLLGTTTTYDNTADDWDLAGVGGVGVEFNVAENLNLSVQGRYNFGLRDIDKSNAEVKSRGIYALGGLGFQF
jgi:opacity protein-like surface antigen